LPFVKRLSIYAYDDVFCNSQIMNPVRDDMSVEDDMSVKNPVRDDMSVEDDMSVKRGCLESPIPSSLRGGTTKQSSNYQPFLDCFTSFAMTNRGFRDAPDMSVENDMSVKNPVRDDMSAGRHTVSSPTGFRIGYGIFFYRHSGGVSKAAACRHCEFLFLKNKQKKITKASVCF
jgi:hypothetical protein